MSTLFAHLEHWRSVDPSAVACIEQGVELTWEDLGRQVDEIAAGLIEQGVEHGDVVAALARPSAEFWATFLAVVSIGGVWLGINPKSTSAERSQLRTHATPRLQLDLIEGRAPRSPHDSSGLRARRDRVRADDIAALVYTSGSTGTPKGAQLSHGALSFCSQVQGEHWGPGERPRIIMNLPVSHVGCIGDLGSYTLVAGGTLVMQPEYDPEQTLQLIEQHRVTHWASVPTMFALSMRTPAWPTADLSSVRTAIWSGGAMPVELARELAQRVDSVLNCYGMTETVGSVTYTAPHDSPTHVASSIGRPDPRFELRLSDDGVVGAEGEIQVRGQCMFSGYLNDPDATRDAFEDGWLRTGDIGRRLPDGSLELIGRRREMFKSGGYNVYPREVEQALERHPAVAIAAVVSHPDPLYGEVGAAWITCREPVDPEQLLSWLRTQIANYKVPKELTVLDELPLLAIGKVDKQALRQLSGARA